MHRKEYLDKKVQEAPTTKAYSKPTCPERKYGSNGPLEINHCFIIFLITGCVLEQNIHRASSHDSEMLRYQQPPKHLLPSKFHDHLPARYLSREEEELRLRPRQTNESQRRRVASTRARIQRSWTSAGSLSDQALRTSMLLLLLFSPPPPSCTT